MINHKPLIIGISGGSGSGKTTIINNLRSIFSTEELCILSQDDYYRKRENQATDKNGIKNFDLPGSIDHKKMVDDIGKLIRGESLEIEEYVFNNQNIIPANKSIYPAPVLIIEGLFIFHFQELADLQDIKVFIHAKDNLKVIRRIKRDKVERNYPIEDVLYRYEHHVGPTFEKYILPFKDDCDIVINNNRDYTIGLEFLKALIKIHLQERLQDQKRQT